MFLIVSKYLIPKGFRGLTVFPFVILRERNDKNVAALVDHEKIHIRQQMELLVVPFFIWYFLEFGVRLIQYKNKERAYRNISFEREAYANESVPEYLRTRPFWGFLKHI